ncbi:hypothetical protein [Nonomuraea africana]|uniref:hypothetical protein n=1 Tax=Nonomuraea africana TaxID=46171 RepID=UPI0033DEC382
MLAAPVGVSSPTAVVAGERRIPAVRAAALMEVASLVRRWASSPSSFSQPVGGSVSAAWPSPSTAVGMVASAAASSAASWWARLASAARRPRSHAVCAVASPARRRARWAAWRQGVPQ